eukprot:gene11921-4052_t
MRVDYVLRAHDAVRQHNAAVSLFNFLSQPGGLPVDGLRREYLRAANAAGHRQLDADIS